MRHATGKNSDRPLVLCLDRGDRSSDSRRHCKQEGAPGHVGEREVQCILVQGRVVRQIVETVHGESEGGTATHGVGDVCGGRCDSEIPKSGDHDRIDKQSWNPTNLQGLTLEGGKHGSRGGVRGGQPDSIQNDHHNYNGQDLANC